MGKVLRLTDGTKDPSKMTKEELEAYKKVQEKEHVEFTSYVEDVDITAKDHRVILVLGDSELVYDKGNFYVGLTVDPNQKKEITKKQAKQIYVDYYSNYNVKSKLKNDLEVKTKDKAKAKEKTKTRTKTRAKAKVKDDDDLVK